MRILYVDQFSKTEGNDTIQLIEKINFKQTKFVIDAFFAENTYLICDSIKTNIFYGFKGAYSGNIFSKGFSYLKALKQLEKFIVKGQYDAVHLQWFSMPWFEHQFIKRIKKKNIKVIVTVHDVIPFKIRAGEMKALNKIYNSADYLIVHSEHAKKQVEEIYSPKEPIGVISSAFCDKDQYSITDKKESREYLGIPIDSFVVLFFGSIRDSKGLDILMDAIKVVHKQYKNIYLLSGGSFQGVDQEKYLNSANEIITEGYGNIKFDFIKKSEEKFYFSAADVLCLPYKSGWQSGVAQLGLVYELPIIASNLKEMEDVIVNNFNGLVFNPNDVDDLSATIMSLVNKPDLLKKYKENDIAIYNSKFSMDAKACDVIGCYSEVFK